MKMKYASVGLLLFICAFCVESLPHNEQAAPSKNSCKDDVDCIRLCSWLCQTPRLGICLGRRCLCQVRPPRSDASLSRHGSQESSRVRCPQSWED